MNLWVIRISFLLLCTVSGYAVSQMRPELVASGGYGLAIGFGLGGLLVAVDEMIRGFSLRAFSAATVGLFFGWVIATLIDASGLFFFVDENTRWIIRLGLFLSFGYIGVILAMRSNKEDFSLIIPYVRFASQQQAENPLVLDTSAVIDGRIIHLIESHFIEGLVVVPRFVLRELHAIADSADPIRRARGQRGLEMLQGIQRNSRLQVKIHEGDFSTETAVDNKLILLAKAIGGKLFTCDGNLARVAELQSVGCVNVGELGAQMKPVLLPGEILSLRVTREGRDKGQGLAYLPDGTMVVINQGQMHIGQNVQVQVSSLLQTGAGVMVFADLKMPMAA